MKLALFIAIFAILIVTISSEEEGSKRSSPKFDRIIKMLENRKEDAEKRVEETRKGGNGERIAEEEKKLESLVQQLEMIKGKVEQTPGVVLKERRNKGEKAFDLTPESIENLKQKRKLAEDKLKNLKDQIHVKDPGQDDL